MSHLTSREPGPGPPPAQGCPKTHNPSRRETPVRPKTAGTPPILSFTPLRDALLLTLQILDLVDTVSAAKKTQIVHQTGPLWRMHFRGTANLPSDRRFPFILSMAAEHGCGQGAGGGKEQKGGIPPYPEAVMTISFQFLYL